MKVHLLSISLCLLSISLSAQNTTWHERLDSSFIEATRVRPESAIIPIKPADLRMTASPMGEADPVKYIQTLPGVSTGMEGSSAYYVRGGNGGNNLTTLDGIPIYGAGHLLGLTTAYPSDIVSKNDFYAGGFPSDAGGFTSSLLQLTTADGDYQKFHGSFFINNFLAGAQASGPLKKDKVSVLTSVRISPIGLEYNLLRPHLDKSLSLPDKINALAGDAFVKINWKTGSRGRMFFSVFGSYDRYAFDPTKLSSQALGWSNLMANLSWQQETLSGWKWEARLSHNGFRAFQDQSQSKSVSGKVISTRMSLESALMEEGLEAKVSKQFGYGLEFKTGLDGFVSFFQPGVTKLFQDSEITATTGQPLATFRSSVYSQIRYGNGPFHASAGARLTAFFSEGYKTLKPIASVLVSYQFLPSLLLKATYDHSVQFFHSLEGVPTGWSMEMLIPSTGQNHPETADQAWVGVEFSKGPFFLSAGGFYKNMKDLVFFADASSFFNSSWSTWQYNLESGTGHSFGLEILSRWESPRISGQLSYTLSKTDRVFSSLNFGHPIPFKFDRRHMLNLIGEFKLAQGKKTTHSLTGGLTFMSGHWETVKSGTYPIYSLGSDDKRETREADYTSHPNNLQLPAYFRLDAGYHLSVQGRKTRHEVSVGVYNLTNRHNAYSLTWDSEDARWKKLSIFPIMPNLKYSITF